MSSNAPETMRIDDVEYVRADSIATPAGPASPVQIVVIEGRWNIVGRVERETETRQGIEVETGALIITSASVIRYWGTTKGLGELAAKGPTSKTILDSTGTIRVPAHAVLLTIDTTADAWSI